ncbi:MAG: glycosyl transferase, group 1 [Bryobacterales bacterium]|nr:glycosyl transferase, group 1 [Bryobacterales bacterium]
MRGGQHQVLLLMRLLAEAGHEPMLLARRKSPLFVAVSEAGYRVHAAGAGAVLRFSGSVDLVHAHDARAHNLCAMASRERFVVSRRVAFPVKRALISRWKYRTAARYLAVSNFVARELEASGVSREDIDVVYDAVMPAAARNEWSPEYPAVALASQDSMKGRDLVEQAAKVSGVEIVYSQNLPQDLCRASMFLYITRSEGLGSAALLALNLGVPVIASRVGGLAEVLEDGTSGIYVQNNVAEIVRAMRRILSSRTLAAQLIEAGQRRISEQFTPGHLLKGTLASYEKALAG